MRYVLLLLIVFVLPTVVGAQEYVPLIGIPGIPNNNLNVNNYIEALYIIAISIAAFGAVIRLILAGLKYILNDVVPNKAQAKKDIQNALIGLLIVVGAVLILNTINPQLTQLNALNIQPFTVTTTGPRAEAVATINSDLSTSDNLDTVEDTRKLSPEELRKRIADCTDGKSPGQWVVVGFTGKCRGNVASSAKDNVVNTQSVLDRYFESANIPVSSQNAFRQEYNDFIGTQEPDNITPAFITAVKSEFGADEVLFVVKNVVPGVGTDTANYQGAQEGICESLTGSKVNFVVASNYSACMR